ncbi:MAG: NAD-dependent epimerase/dehydratase family protein [Acidimicrobiales bacterium]
MTMPERGPDQPRPGPTRPALTLVTGASGVVGRNLVAHLLELGWPVRTFARRPWTGPEAGRVEQVQGDVRDQRRVAEAMDGVEVVFHLAARVTLRSDDPDAWSVNVDGSAVVAEAARRAGVRRLVHCSSVHAFDASRAGALLDERCPRSGVDRPLYDRTKAAGEVAVRRVVAEGLDATIINPTGIIGPVDPDLTRINRLMRSAARGRLPLITGGGFDFVDVRDVASAAVAAVDRGRTGENYLVAGHWSSALRLARMAAGLNGRLGPVLAVPTSVARLVAPLAERIGGWLGTDSFTPASVDTLIEATFVDGTRSAVELGHHPRPLEDTMRDLIWWMVDAGLLVSRCPPSRGGAARASTASWRRRAAGDRCGTPPTSAP